MRGSCARRSSSNRTRGGGDGADRGAPGRAGRAPGKRDGVRARLAAALPHRARDGVLDDRRGSAGAADWREALAVRQLAIEAAGVYWRPVWAVLEDRFECLLVNA